MNEIVEDSSFDSCGYGLKHRCRIYPLKAPVYNYIKELKRLNDAKDERIVELEGALNRIVDCVDAPDIDPVGEWQQGLHCGVEDIDCVDRYDGADYGYTQGMERGIEWAMGEACAALNEVAIANK